MRTQWIFGSVAAVACAASIAFAAVAPPWPLVASEKLEKGKFLIASPRTGGPYFRESVVLLLEYGPMGAMGLIINRPTEVELGQLFPDDEALKDLSERAFFGGPVERRRMLWLFRTSAPPAEARRVTGDTHASGSIETLRALVASGDAATRYRVYVGFAGWAPRQLDGEVARGDWLISASDARAVFEMEPKKVWREFIERSFRLQAGRPERPRTIGAAAADAVAAGFFRPPGGWSFRQDSIGQARAARAPATARAASPPDSPHRPPRAAGR